MRLAADGDGIRAGVLAARAVIAPAQMQPGTMIGLNYLVDDDGKHAECFYSDNSAMDGWRTPVTWGAIVLAE